MKIRLNEKATASFVQNLLSPSKSAKRENRFFLRMRASGALTRLSECAFGIGNGKSLVPFNDDNEIVDFGSSSRALG